MPKKNASIMGKGLEANVVEEAGDNAFYPSLRA